MSIFNSVPIHKPKRSNFNQSHSRNMTTDFAWLSPSCFFPVLPGDVIKARCEAYIRMAPMYAPVMSQCNVYHHWFFLPTRLLFEQYEDFFTGGKSGQERPVYPRLKIKVEQLLLKDGFTKRPLIGAGSLWDYLGFPTCDLPPGGVAPDNYIIVDLLPFLAYYKIWQNYYADQNLQDFVFDDQYKFEEGVIDFDSLSSDKKSEILELFRLRQRSWEKDYFTSALPTPQRGDDVRLPIIVDGKVPVVNREPGGPWNVIGVTDNSTLGTLRSSGNSLVSRLDSSGDSFRVQLDPNGTLETDLSGLKVGSPSITEVRRMFSLQRFKERMAVVGWRYFEYLQGIFGVKNPDSRMQRPEYLGGGKAPVVIGEVLQTSQTTSGDNGSPLGEMAGRGVSAARDNGWRRKFGEYGYVFCIQSVIPRSSYCQGWPRWFNKFDPLEYANPYFATIGEQQVDKGELYFDFKNASLDVFDGVTGLENGGVNKELFGYQSRYSEYKFIPSTFHGDFRTSMTNWHLGRIFDKAPALNADFVTVHPEETSRIFNVESANGDPVDHLWCQVFNNIKMSRCLPYYGTPR